MAIVDLQTVAAEEKRSAYAPPERSTEVEISPDRFLSVKRRDWVVDDPRNASGCEKTQLVMRYGGTDIKWEGVDIPIVLRDYMGMLFMVGYDRETGRVSGDGTPRYNYYRQESSKLVAIRREEFPKVIATQNLFVTDDATRRALIALDTASAEFQTSQNAYVWKHLVTGQACDSAGVDKRLLDTFIETYKPQALTTIRRVRR